MSAQALMGNSFYEKMIEDLDRLPASVQEWIKGMQETFSETVYNNPWALRHVPDYLKTQKMCNRAVEKDPWLLERVPDCFKTPEMSIKGVEKDPWLLKDVPNHFKTQEMYDEAVRE